MPSIPPGMLLAVAMVEGLPGAGRVTLAPTRAMTFRILGDIKLRQVAEGR